MWDETINAKDAVEMEIKKVVTGTEGWRGCSLAKPWTPGSPLLYLLSLRIIPLQNATGYVL